MDELLLSLHVVASIVFIGPITVAASLFPRYARRALTPVSPGSSGVAGAAGYSAAESVAVMLHRISRGLRPSGAARASAGAGDGAVMGVLGQKWVLISIALTAVAAGLFAVIVFPG